MSFLTLIFKNLSRHRSRAILTILGISIGIATIVVFGLITSGLTDAIGNVIKPGNADFTVAKAGSADIVLSFLDKEQVEVIRTTEGVAEIAPFVFTISQSGGNPYFVIGGTDAENLGLQGVKVTEGRPYSSDDEIIIGKIVAKNKNLSVGDSLEIKGKNYAITGIFESGVSYQDSGSLVTVEESQRIQGITGKVNLVSVVVTSDSDIREVADRIEAADSDLVSIVDIEDFDAIDQGRQVTESISLAISLVAVIIGAIGVMNTIIMSVFERTREIGVLRAVGWKKRRIVLMILGESLVLGVIAAFVGILIGLIIVWLIGQTDIGRAWITVKYEPIIFARAFFVSIAVVLIGSIYPAFRASRLKPTEALKYE